MQATYLGYPGSTGVPNIDWLIGDAVVTPPEDDALCSERVARLPGVVFCFAPETDYPLPNWDAPEFLARPITFGSFNNVPKLTPRTLALWARVLSEVPGSRLVLKAPSFGDPGAVRAFSQRLAALGVDLARVEFRGPVGLDLMMAEYADIDIALDPTPYNGGTTSLQAMWMGVPVLTLYGQHFVSRMGASFMRAARLPDWVVTNEDDYVRMARCMAADRRALLQLKRALRGRLRALPGWDVVAHTRAMEAAFEQMARAGACVEAREASTSRYIRVFSKCPRSLRMYAYIYSARQESSSWPTPSCLKTAIHRLFEFRPNWLTAGGISNW